MPGAAARVAGWQRRYGGWPATTPATPPAPAFPQVPLDLNVKIQVDSSWIDITDFVYQRVDMVVTRGRPNETTKVDPSTLVMQVNNRNGQFSPRNPTSWLYGKIGRNTPCQVAIAADVRFSGEISEWPQRWDVTGRDVYVPLQAAGILRRLTQGASPLHSTLYRGITTLVPPPRAYWPCEDDAAATQIASGIGGPAMIVLGTKAFAQFTEFKCSEPLPLATGAEWKGTVPAYPNTLQMQVWFPMRLPTAGGSATAGQQIIRIYTTGGTVAWWDLIYETGGDLRLKAFDGAGTVLLDSGLGGFAVNNKLLRVSVELIQVVATQVISWKVVTLEVGQSTGTTFSGTLSPQQMGRCSRVVVNPGADVGNLAVGHIAVNDQIRDLLTLSKELNAYTGETAGRRVQRLCSEEGVAFRAVGNLDASTLMGAQTPSKLLDLLQECADADQGILYEPRDFLGLAYRTRENLYNQAPVLQLDYTSKHLSGIEPTDDDQLVRNDITATRVGGSSARAIQQDGALSVQPPPAGVGRYDEQVTVNVQADSQLADVAGWRLHLGTVDEARYPILSLDLARAPFTSDPALAATIRHLDAGDRLTVVHPPVWLPPDPITQLAQGFTETMNAFTHRIGVNCSPESPWGQAAVYGSPASRYSSSGSTLAAALGTADTSVSVATSGPRLWSHADGDFAIRVGGEVMTVTAVTGVTSPQTFTVTRSVNGVTKTHSSGEAVALDHPVVYVP